MMPVGIPEAALCTERIIGRKGKGELVRVAKADLQEGTARIVLPLRQSNLIAALWCRAFGPELNRKVSFTQIDLGTTVDVGVIACKVQGRSRRQGGRLSRAFAICHYAAFMYPAEVLGDDALWAQVKPFVERSYGEREGPLLAAQWQACLDYDITGRLPHCQVPLHVIAFSEDLQTPPRHGRRVAELAPNGHFHLLEGLGHCSAFGHKPEVVNACIAGIIGGYP